jgi:succinoglycan biosynthesis protein ExoM
MQSPAHHISICVCTFKRPRLLARLLEQLNTQKTDGVFSYSVVVVDNDDQESGRSAVESARTSAKYAIEYDVEPQRSISHARNRSVRNATGDLVAFIDDDEFPDDAWLLTHLKTLLSTKADGVLGPVKPHFEGEGPAWLVKSGLLERASLKTDEVIRDSIHTRTGNVLLWRRIFDDPDGHFDARYGRSGGGDAVFFKTMMAKGKVFVWCNEAVVYETVLPERQTRKYYLKRAFTRGMTEAWATSPFRMSTLKSLVAIVVYTCALPFLLLAGQHAFMKCLVKNCDHLAKILGYMGIRVIKERPYTAASSG